MTPSPHDPTTQPPSPSEAGGRRTLAAAAMALVLAAGVGGTAVALTSADAAATNTEVVSADQDLRAGRASIDEESALDGESALDDVTLAELAEELDRLGLDVRIVPADSDYERDGDAESGDDVDPFDGMTDDEIDALSDEEFFDRIEAAGIDIDDYFDDAEFDDADFDNAEEADADHDHGSEAEPLATVTVDGDRIDTSDLSPEVAEKAQAIWQRFAKLIPADQRQMVSTFELLDDDYQGAHVYPDEADPTKWVLGVGTGLGDDLDYVLIHEFGHLLTLQADEVPPSEDNGSCPTYHTGEGCALSGSTFAEFVGKFWPQDMRDTVNELYENEDYDGLDDFYQENKDRFVTDYAASNPAEDLAETFAVFVTEDRPSGDTIADQKVELLWSDPAMVELRDQIRAAL